MRDALAARRGDVTSCRTPAVLARCGGLAAEAGLRALDDDVDLAEQLFCWQRGPLTEPFLHGARERLFAAAGTASSGGLYCAFSQSAHRWLDRLLRARAAVTGRPGLDAVALLVQDRCARQAARLGAAWREADAPDAAGEETFGAVHRAWDEHLGSRPPREMPGCAGCPARCRMLADVAALPGDVLEAVAARATATISPMARARSLTAIPHPALRAALAERSDDRARRDLLYCAVTTATADIAESPTELLAVLRDTK